MDEGFIRTGGTLLIWVKEKSYFSAGEPITQVPFYGIPFLEAYRCTYCDLVVTRYLKPSD